MRQLLHGFDTGFVPVFWRCRAWACFYCAIAIVAQCRKKAKKKRERMTRLAQFKPKPPNLPHAREGNMPDKKRKPAGLCAGRQAGKA